MNERDKLIALLESSEGAVYWNSEDKNFVEKIADYLIANGVIVPPCKVGDKIYQTDGVRIYESTINEITFTTHHIICDTEDIAFNEQAIGKIVFLTREEAQKALREAQGNE